MPSRHLFGVSHLSTFGVQMCSSGAVLAPSTTLAVVGTICLANPPKRGDHTSRNRVRQKLSRSGTRQDRWEGTNIHGPKEVRRSAYYQTVLVGVNTAENEVATWLLLIVMKHHALILRYQLWSRRRGWRATGPMARVVSIGTLPYTARTTIEIPTSPYPSPGTKYAIKLRSRSGDGCTRH